MNLQDSVHSKKWLTYLISSRRGLGALWPRQIQGNFSHSNNPNACQRAFKSREREFLIPRLSRSGDED